MYEDFRSAVGNRHITEKWGAHLNEKWNGPPVFLTRMAPESPAATSSDRAPILAQKTEPGDELRSFSIFSERVNMSFVVRGRHYARNK